ncbi:MAG: hypothetical protein HEQ13_06865 [Dolichospermum sp. DEX189]|jgi:type I restriction enzyme S subunit|nr:hypothetical protein [Dolichospermum sp. DEX189]
MSNLPKGWNVLALNQICDLQNGYAFKSNDYVNISNTLNCRMSNIRPNGFFDLEHNQKFLPDSYTQKYQQYLLKDGDVIIAMTDMATEAKILGVPTIVETQGKNLLLNQRVGKLIIKKPELIYFPYLKYVLNREQVKKYFLKFAGGGLQINLGKDDILSVEIPLPPLEEQKRIAEILDLAEELRTKRREAITPNAEKIIVLYLFYYLLNPNVREKFLFPFVTKSTISGINQGNLAKVLVMIPPLHLQQEFSQRVEAVEKLKASHRASLSELDALFASLQHRAFRGEL